MTGLLVCIFFLLPSLTFAGDKSAYIYIQGDKELPFYVRVAGKMLPRYAKDYCIVPLLKGGEVEIEVLFEQNKSRTEFFSLSVTEGGQKGFLLTKKCNDCVENQYYLCDISTGDVLKPIIK